MCAAHALADVGETEILAVVHNTGTVVQSCSAAVPVYRLQPRYRGGLSHQPFLRQVGHNCVKAGSNLISQALSVANVLNSGFAETRFCWAPSRESSVSRWRERLAGLCSDLHCGLLNFLPYV